MRALTIVLFVALVITLAYAVASPAQAKYTTKYDNIDVDQILRNDRLLKNYVDCVLDRGRCTKEGLELKKHIPEAIATDCAKCSEKQKKIAGKILAYLLQYKKDYWNELLDRYDPEGDMAIRGNFPSYELKKLALLTNVNILRREVRGALPMKKY